MADKRKLIGNEMVGGSQKLRPRIQQTNRALFTNSESMRVRREQLIRFAADPPRIPAPAKVEAAFPDYPTFSQFAYSVLLIAILAVVSVGTDFINWAFLAYGILAVAARLPSSQMFVVALISLVFIPLTTSLHKDDLANDFAVMTFYFLVIGLIRAALELRRENINAQKKVK